MARAGTERDEAQALVERLRERREEIEQTLLARVYAISDPKEVGDSEYALGLRTAVSAALDYALTVLEEGELRTTRTPPELLVQARMAACHGVALETVLRRYIAGHALFDDFIVQETEAIGDSGRAVTQRALREEAVALELLVDAVASEYRDEVEARKSPSRSQRRAAAVRGLLKGELADTRELDYDLTVWHLALVASGPEAADAMGSIARDLGDRQQMVIPGVGGTVWVWLNGTHKPDSDKFASFFPVSRLPTGVKISVGEPGYGLDGWRLTHHQAAAALPIAQRRGGSVTRYVDVGLLASALQDEVLIRSFQDLYLAPLANGRGSETVLRETLRAYFEAERNAASAAALLGVTRQTVTNRLRMVEECLSRPIGSCATELEMSLELNELSEVAESSSSDAEAFGSCQF